LAVVARLLHRHQEHHLGDYKVARVERFTAQGEIPVQQAQLIDPGGFPADTSSAEALKTAANVTKVMAELAKRRQAAQDSTSATKAGHSRTLAELEIQQFMVDSPDPNTWEDGLAKISAKYSANYVSLKMSSKTREEQDIEQQAHNNEMAMRVRLAATNQDIKNDITEAKINLDGLIANDDGSKGDADKIDKALTSLEDALLRETTPEIAAEQMEEALSAAKKGFWINQSRLRPDEIITQMQKKKKGLGKKGEDEDGLSARDMDDIIGSAYNAKALARKSLDTEQEANRDEISKAITVNDPSTISLIESSSLDETEQWTWKQRYHGEQERRAKGLDIITDNTIKTELNNDIFRVLTGDAIKSDIIDKAVAARYNPTNPTLSEGDYQKFLTSINAQYEEAYKGGMSKVNTDARGILLQPDSLGFVRNAPIRFREFGKFQEAWMEWVRSQGDKLKIADIYPEGMRIAALHQKSEKEIERLEDELGKELEEREADAKEAGNEENAKIFRDEQKKLNLGRSVTAGLKKAIAEAELKKILKPSEKFKNQIDILKLNFNLSKAETDKAREFLDKGATLDQLLKHLQSK